MEENKRRVHQDSMMNSKRYQPKEVNLKRLKKLVKRSEEHTSELQSHSDLVCRLLLEKKNKKKKKKKKT